MISLEKIHDYIVVSGPGIELLKLKAEIDQAIGGVVESRGRGKFAIPLAAFSLLPDSVLSSASADVKTRWAIEKETSATAGHEMARERITDFLAGGVAPVPSIQIEGITLDDHQEIAVQCMTLEGLKGLCLFDEQGAGKTVMAIAAFSVLQGRGDVKGMFIVSPKAMVSVWQDEIKKFTPIHKISVIAGSKSEKFRKVNTEADVYITNFEAVDPVLTSLKGIADFSPMLLVVDESFFAKNPEAYRSKLLNELRAHCKIAFVLCGTPAPNSPTDIINQFNLADGGYTFMGAVIPKDPDEEEAEIMLRINTRGAFIRRLKEDVFDDMSKKNFIIITADMAPLQAKIYHQIRENLFIYLKKMDNTEFRKNFQTYLQRRINLLLACVAPAEVDSMYDQSEEDPGKYLELDALIDKVVCKRDEKVIVWSYFRKPLDDIVCRYRHFGSVKIDGRTTMQERKRIVYDFQNSDSPKILVANPAAAGAGLTLTRARTAIYMSFPFQAAHYLQSLDRIHRRGQKMDVDYFLIVCRDTVEEKEIERLSLKEKNQQRLLGDKTESLTLEDALKEISLQP